MKGNGRPLTPVSDWPNEAWLEFLLQPDPYISHREAVEPPPIEEHHDEILIEKAAAGVTFRLRGFKDGAALRSGSWLIDHVLPAQGAAMLFAPSGVGKTWLGLDWAVAVASGKKWLDRPLMRGSVVYVAAEGAFTIPGRVAAIKKNRGIDEKLPIFTVSESIVFNDVSTHPSILADALREQIEAWKWPPTALVVVDTYTACIKGSANDDDAAADFMRGFRQFLRHATPRGAPQPLGLIVHHPGLQDEARGRGSSAFTGDLDCIMRLEEVAQTDADGIPPELPAPETPPDRAFLLNCSKMRGGVEFPDLPLALRHFVPLDDRGEPVQVGEETLTGLVVGPVDGQVVRATKKERRAAEKEAERRADEVRALGVLDGLEPVHSEEWRKRSEIRTRRAWAPLRDALVDSGKVVQFVEVEGAKHPFYKIRTERAE